MTETGVMYVAIIARHGFTNPEFGWYETAENGAIYRTSMDLILANHLPAPCHLDAVLLEGFDLSDISSIDREIAFYRLPERTPIARIDPG